MIENCVVFCGTYTCGAGNGVLTFCSQHGRRVQEGAKGLFGHYVKKKNFSNEKHETERRAAFTHYLSQITKK